MTDSINKINILKDRGLLIKNEGTGIDEVIKLRANVQRNQLSANLMVNIIARLSDEIEALKNEIKELKSPYENMHKSLFRDDISIKDIEKDNKAKSKNKSKE